MGYPPGAHQPCDLCESYESVLSVWYLGGLRFFSAESYSAVELVTRWCPLWDHVNLSRDLIFLAVCLHTTEAYMVTGNGHVLYGISLALVLSLLFLLCNGSELNLSGLHLIHFMVHMGIPDALAIKFHSQVFGGFLSIQNFHFNIHSSRALVARWRYLTFKFLFLEWHIFPVSSALVFPYTFLRLIGMSTVYVLLSTGDKTVPCGSYIIAIYCDKAVTVLTWKLRFPRKNGCRQNFVCRGHKLGKFMSLFLRYQTLPKVFEISSISALSAGYRLTLSMIVSLGILVIVLSGLIALSSLESSPL